MVERREECGETVKDTSVLGRREDGQWARSVFLKTIASRREAASVFGHTIEVDYLTVHFYELPN